jgi:2-polyprenyl-3-methyl-5-hydroxy-6-metoxy-1,4-benzoquinol methylase
MKLAGEPPPQESYSRRLVRLQRASWKRLIPVQLPYRLHLKALRPGATLELGCGIGRNLSALGRESAGIDIDAESVRYVREVLRLTAYTPDEFRASAHGTGAQFDTLLLSHVLEHVHPESIDALVSPYLRHVRQTGRIVIFTPQERGFASDATHVAFFDFQAGKALAQRLGLEIERQYSFPFPRRVGRIFTYNEFVTLLRFA